MSTKKRVTQILCIIDESDKNLNAELDKKPAIALQWRIYKEGLLRVSLQPGSPSRTWTKGKYKERAHAHVGQATAQKEVHYRMYQRAAQE